MGVARDLVYICGERERSPRRKVRTNACLACGCTRRERGDPKLYLAGGRDRETQGTAQGLVQGLPRDCPRDCPKIAQRLSRAGWWDCEGLSRIVLMGETQPAATPSASQELEALELARGRLEAVLANDENWRALSQAGAEDVDRAGRAARQARNTRLEMALAGNAHYQAWKHLNGAIAALRARNAGQASQLDDSAQPLPEAPARTGGAAHAPVASVGPAGPQRLAERLGQLEGPQIEAIALPGEGAGRGAVAAKGRRGSRVRADAPEA